MKKFWRIFRHEYLRHVLRWRFVMALLSVPLWLAMMLLMMVISVMVQFDRTPIGYVDQAHLIQISTLPDEINLPFLDPPIQSYETEAAARAALDAKKIQAYYVLPPDFLQTRSVRLVYREKAPTSTAAGQFTQLVQLNLLASQPEEIALRVTSGASVSFQTVGERADGAATDSPPFPVAGSGAVKEAESGSADKGAQEAPFPFSTPQVRETAPAPITPDYSDNRASSSGGSGGPLREIIKMLAPFAAAIFLFSAVLTSSGYLMQAVVDEKENRTMEILVTSVSPGTIMNGKISALICVGLTQMFFWIVPPLALLLVAKAYLPFFPALPAFTPLTGLMMATTLPTFVMISAMMATVGASVTEAREGQQVMSLFNLLLMSPFIFSAAILARPDGPIAVGLSFFPFTATLTLLLRASFSNVPAWQVAVCSVILILAAAGALWLSGRVFRLGMLNYGKRLGWREVLRAVTRRGVDNRAAARAEEGPR